MYSHENHIRALFCFVCSSFEMEFVFLFFRGRDLWEGKAAYYFHYGRRRCEIFINNGQGISFVLYFKLVGLEWLQLPQFVRNTDAKYWRFGLQRNDSQSISWFATLHSVSRNYKVNWLKMHFYRTRGAIMTGKHPIHLSKSKHFTNYNITSILLINVCNIFFRATALCDNGTIGEWTSADGEIAPWIPQGTRLRHSAGWKVAFGTFSSRLHAHATRIWQSFWLLAWETRLLRPLLFGWGEHYHNYIILTNLESKCHFRERLRGATTFEAISQSTTTCLEHTSKKL